MALCLANVIQHVVWSTNTQNYACIALWMYFRVVHWVILMPYHHCEQHSVDPSMLTFLWWKSMLFFSMLESYQIWAVAVAETPAFPDWIDCLGGVLPDLLKYKMKMVHGVQIFPNQHPLALITQDNHHRVRKIDPTWASHQTCWNCSKIGHVHQKCTTSQAKSKHTGRKSTVTVLRWVHKSLLNQKCM